MQVFQKLKALYADSFFAVICKKIANAYNTSILVSLHTAGTLDGALSESVLLGREQSNRRMHSGLMLAWLYQNAHRMLAVPFGQAACLCAFWCLGFALSAGFSGNILQTVLFLATAAVLFPFMRTRVSLRGALSESLIGRFFEWDFEKRSEKQNYFVWALIGAAAVLSASFLTYKWSVIIVGALIGLLLLPVLKPIVLICLLALWLPIGGTGGCIVLCVLLILSHLLQRLFGRIDRQKADYVDVLLSVFILLCIGGSLISFSVLDSLRVSAMWIPLFASVFIIYRNIRNQKDLIVVLTALLIGSFIACIIGLWQYFSGQVDTTWTDTELFEDLNIRIFSTFANPNVFGEFLLLIVPLAAGLGLYFSKWKYKIVCFAMAIISFAALALTYSRGCYVGIAITAVIFIWMYSKKLFGALLVLGVPIGIAMMPQNMVDRIISIGNFADSSTSYRLKIYAGTLELLKTYWPSGLGIGETAFNYVYPFFGIQNVVTPHTHSLFFQIMISFGIAGMIFFLLLFFVYHRNLLSLAKKQPRKSKDRILLITFGSLFFGFLVQSIFDYTWYNYRVYTLFWMMLAFGFSAYKFIRDRGSAR